MRLGRLSPELAEIKDKESPAASRIKAAGKVVMSLAGVGLAAGALVHANLIKDVLSDSHTPQEARLGQAFDAAFQVEGTSVHCRPADYVNELYLKGAIPKLVGGVIVGAGIPYTDNLWLEQGYCNALTDIQNGADVTYRINSLGIAAHEGAHALANVFSEAEAQCVGVKHAASLAEALGAHEDPDHTLTELVGKQVAAIAEHSQSANYRFDPNLC